MQNFLNHTIVYSYLWLLFIFSFYWVFTVFFDASFQSYSASVLCFLVTWPKVFSDVLHQLFFWNRERANLPSSYRSLAFCRRRARSGMAGWCQVSVKNSNLSQAVLQSLLHKAPFIHRPSRNSFHWDKWKKAQEDKREDWLSWRKKIPPKRNNTLTNNPLNFDMTWDKIENKICCTMEIFIEWFKY